MRRPEAEGTSSIDAIVSLLSSNMRTADPKIIPRVIALRRSFFASMTEDDLSTIYGLISEYDKDELSHLPVLLMVCEREMNEFYSQWISGEESVSSALTSSLIMKAAYVVPAMTALSMPVYTPGVPSKGAEMLLMSPEEESVDTFLGRLLEAEVTGQQTTSDPDHLAWIGRHMPRLMPFVGHLRLIGSMDRSVCEAVLNSPSPLASGAI